VTDQADGGQGLTLQHAYEAAYRLLAHYYDFERTAPLLRLLQTIAWTGGSPGSNAEAWAVWQDCVRQTLDGAPLPELPPPWDE
jgi:hypothetical protein